MFPPLFFAHRLILQPVCILFYYKDVLYLNTQSQQLLHEIINYAESGDHRSFTFINNRSEYVTLRKGNRVLKLIIKSLRSSVTKLLKDYCKEVANGDPQFTRLLMVNTLEKAIAFYEQEFSTLSNMLEEYEEYLMSGNFSDFVFNDRRPEDKLWDHRGV